MMLKAVTLKIKKCRKAKLKIKIIKISIRPKIERIYKLMVMTQKIKI